MADLAHCRLCGALIRWAKTAANGRPIPLDPDASERGVAYFDGEGLVHVIPAQTLLFAAEAPAPAVRYVPHFATCPKYRQRVERVEGQPAEAEGPPEPVAPERKVELQAFAQRLSAARRS